MVELSMLAEELSPEEQSALCAFGKRKRFAEGQTIFCRGDDAEQVFVIEDGLVEISVTSTQGRKSVLNHMSTGEILGEIAFLDRGNRSADAVALSETELVALDRRAIAAFLHDNPDAMLDLIAALCAKARNATEMAESYALGSAAARLARCLLHVARKWGQQQEDGRVVFLQNFSQGDLGELAGIARENVNRHLRGWERDGVVTFDKGVITILDIDTLAEIAEL